MGGTWVSLDCHRDVDHLHCAVGDHPGCLLHTQWQLLVDRGHRRCQRARAVCVTPAP